MVESILCPRNFMAFTSEMFDEEIQIVISEQLAANIKIVHFVLWPCCIICQATDIMHVLRTYFHILKLCFELSDMESSKETRSGAHDTIFDSIFSIKHGHSW